MNEPVETIHVYIVKEDAGEKPVVDSTVQDAAKIATQPLVMKSYSTHLRLVPYLLIAAHLLIVLTAFSVHVYLLLTETATITIMPKTYHLTTQLTLSTVQSRIFQPVTLTQTKTVGTTGHGHQDAQQASGLITFYNAASQEQTIAAGTLLTGADGVAVVTDQEAVLPGSQPPVETQVTVSAHAVNPGIHGNIKAGAITGSCCRINIFVSNNPFSGGQDERNFQTVSQADIHRVVSSLLPTLTMRIQTSFQQQVHAGEILTPNQCSQNITSDRNAGDEASQVTVTASESCLAGAYNQQSLQMQVTNAFLHSALTHTGTGYMLHSLHPMITRAGLQKDHLLLTVMCQGDMIYHFSTRELTTLREQLAGKTKQQGISVLSHLNGVDHLTVQVEKNGTFPTDPTHIHIVFLIVT